MFLMSSSGASSCSTAPSCKCSAGNKLNCSSHKQRPSLETAHMIASKSSKELQQLPTHWSPFYSENTMHRHISIKLKKDLFRLLIRERLSAVQTSIASRVHSHRQAHHVHAVPGRCE